MLVHNLAKFKEYIQSTAGFNFDQVERHLQKAQQTDLSRMFGSAFIAAMDARWNNGAPSPALSAQEATLIAMLQTAQANLGYVKALPFLTVTNTSSGLAQAETPVNKPLFKWQKLELQDGAIEAAFEATESAIVYLIANRDNSAFALWKNSAAEAAQLAHFINTAQDFNTYYAIANSRRTFEAIKAVMRDAEEMYIKKTLGLNLYNEIKAQVAAQNVSANNLLLMGNIKSVVANYTMAIAIYKGDFRFDENGARLVSTMSTGGSDTSQVKSIADANTKRDISTACKELGNSYLQDLVSYLEANASTYPLYTPTANVAFDNSTGASFLI